MSPFSVQSTGLLGSAVEIDALLIKIVEASRRGDDVETAPVLAEIARHAEEARALHAQLTERMFGVSADGSSCGISAVGHLPPPVPVPPPKLESIVMANPTGAKELILIVDHEVAALRQTEALLTEDDYRVITARDGFEAISLYNRLWTAIDLVILDFALPGLSGDLIFDELLGINPKVACLVSSGFHQPAKLSAMLAKGLCGFLPKPFERAKLLGQIGTVLARRPR